FTVGCGTGVENKAAVALGEARFGADPFGLVASAGPGPGFGGIGLSGTTHFSGRKKAMAHDRRECARVVTLSSSTGRN
ncbi:MAG: hypothetical protein WA361_07670, partial [Candidatus Acidiferrales bacterium]